jgi:hypothetical protein
MNKSKFLSIIGAAAALAFAYSAEAGPIAGSIGFGGNYAQNGGIAGNLMTATSMSISFPSVIIVDASGAFGPLGTATLLSFMTSVGVNGNLNNNVPANNVLWSIQQGPRTYTFTVTSESQVFTVAHLLDLQGGAVVTDDLANSSTGTWTLQFGASSIGGGSGSFTWNNSSAALPDGGTTGMLLGGALSLLALVRKKLLV